MQTVLSTRFRSKTSSPAGEKEQRNLEVIAVALTCPIIIQKVYSVHNIQIKQTPYFTCYYLEILSHFQFVELKAILGWVGCVLGNASRGPRRIRVIGMSVSMAASSSVPTFHIFTQTDSHSTKADSVAKCMP